MYRYRLDGFDRDWSEPVTDRQAVYTNLQPGPLSAFASSPPTVTGCGTGSEAAVSFEFSRRSGRRPGSRLSVVLVSCLAGWGLYRLRVRQVARQLSVRFEARLAERTHIAQELHDTLLQGFVSASMQLHVAVDRLPEDSPAKTSLGRVADLMGRVIDEGRNAVRGLRSSTGRRARTRTGVCRHPAGTRRRSARGVSRDSRRPAAISQADGPRRGLPDWPRRRRERVPPRRRDQHRNRARIRATVSAGVRSRRRSRRRSAGAAYGQRRPLGHHRHARTGRTNWRHASRCEAVPRREPRWSCRSPPAGLQSRGVRPVTMVAGQVLQADPRLLTWTERRTTMSNDGRIRVFSVDDHPLLREGIAAIIDSQARHGDGCPGVHRSRGDSAVSRTSPGRHADGSPAA